VNGAAALSLVEEENKQGHEIATILNPVVAAKIVMFKKKRRGKNVPLSSVDVSFSFFFFVFRHFVTTSFQLFLTGWHNNIKHKQVLDHHSSKC